MLDSRDGRPPAGPTMTLDGSDGGARSHTDASPSTTRLIALGVGWAACWMAAVAWMLLAEGAFGTVYRATQLAVDRPVAVELLHDWLAGSPRHATRFRQKARDLARLRHPGLVQTRCQARD